MDFVVKVLKKLNTQNNNAIAVMAVSNLPCELPKDASYDFGSSMITKIFPLITSDFNHKNISLCNNM